MKRALSHILRNKTFYIFLVLTLFMFPNTLFQQGDKSRTAIVTAVAVDVAEDKKYEVSILTVIPKGGSQVNANLELFSSKDDSIVKALDSIGDSLGKNIGLSHCDCIILSEEVIKEDICMVLDYFIRNANMSNNASVIVSKDKSKEMLEASKSASNLYDLTLKDIVKYSNDDNYNTSMNIEQFYEDYFSFDSISILPLLEIEETKIGGEDESGSSQSGDSSSSSQSSSSGNSSDSSGSSGGGSNTGTTSKNVKNNNDSVILKKGKYINTLTKDENYIYKLLSDKSKHENITVKDVTDSIVTNATEIYRVVDKYHYRHVYEKDGRFKADFYSYLVLELEEIKSDNYELKAIENLEEYITPEVKDRLLGEIKQKFYHSVEEIKETDQDVLKIGREFYSYTHSKWKDKFKDNNEEYLDDIDFTLYIDVAFKL